MKQTIKMLSFIKSCMFTVVGILMLNLLPSAGMSQVPGGPGGGGPGGSGGSPDGNPVVPFDTKMTVVFLLIAVVFAVFTIKKLQHKPAEK